MGGAEILQIGRNFREQVQGFASVEYGRVGLRAPHIGIKQNADISPLIHNDPTFLLSSLTAPSSPRPHPSPPLSSPPPHPSSQSRTASSTPTKSQAPPPPPSPTPHTKPDPDPAPAPESPPPVDPRYCCSQAGHDKTWSWAQTTPHTPN